MRYSQVKQPVATIAGVNNELEKIANSIDDMVSRKAGDGPNTLDATLDANSQRIINLPEPVTNTEPVRKADFDDLGNNLRSDVYTAVRDAEDATDDAISAANSANAAASNANTAADNAYQAIADLESDGYAVISQIESNGNTVINQIESDGTAAINALRVVNAGSFEDGATLTARNEVLYYLAKQTYYRWDGALPKTVPAGSTPAGTGGVGNGAWINVGQAELASALADPDRGAAFIARGVVAVDSIADLLALPEGQRKEGLRYLVKGYYAGRNVGGGAFYWDPDKYKSEADGGTIIDPDNSNDFDGMPTSLSNFLNAQGNGAGAGCWVRLLDGSVSPEMFGAVGDGVADDTRAIQAAIDVASAVFGVVELGEGEFSVSTITPKSNVKLVGKGGATTIIVQQPPLPNVFTGFYLNGGQLSNFHVRGIRFDGNRVANPINPNNKIFYLRTNAGSDVIRNVTWEDCEFVDAQEDFIRVLSSVVATIEQVYAYRCSFRGTKLGLEGAGGGYPGNAFRFINVAGGLASNYGVKACRFIGVIDCYAEHIRTLADFKRGSSLFDIHGCKTKNMYDCHHSVDGAIGGRITGNECYVSPGFDATIHGGTNTNFLEVQGEDIVVANNILLSDGARMVNGILISDYGYPDEGDIGHRSKNIKVRGNAIRHISSNGIKIVNGVSCSVEGNSIEDVDVSHPVAIDSGGGRTDGTSELIAESCFVGGNVSRGVPRGFKLAGDNHIYAPNWDERGQDYFYLPSEALHSALTYADITVVGGSSQLNPNPHLVLSGEGPDNIVDFTNTEEAVLSADRPLTTARGVTLQDNSTTANQEVKSVRLVRAKPGDRFYFRVWVKKGTAPRCAVLVQELDSEGSFILSRFLGLTNPPTDWAEYVAACKVENSETKFIRFSLVPAASSNTPINVGTTSFANFRVSKTMIGLDS